MILITDAPEIIQYSQLNDSQRDGFRETARTKASDAVEDDLRHAEHMNSINLEIGEDTDEDEAQNPCDVTDPSYLLNVSRKMKNEKEINAEYLALMQEDTYTNLLGDNILAMMAKDST